MCGFHSNNLHSTLKIVTCHSSSLYWWLQYELSFHWQGVRHLLPSPNSKLQSFNLSPECRGVGQALIQSAMQNSCLAARNVNNKEDDTTAVAVSTAGDPNSTNQKHETKLEGIDEGSFMAKISTFFVLLSVEIWIFKWKAVMDIACL